MENYRDSRAEAAEERKKDKLREWAVLRATFSRHLKSDNSGNGSRSSVGSLRQIKRANTELN